MSEAARQLHEHAKSARSIVLGARVEAPGGAVEVRASPHGVWWQAGTVSPVGLLLPKHHGYAASIEAALTDARNALHGSLRPESVTVKASKAPVASPELRALATDAFCAAWCVSAPDPDALAKLRKAFAAEQRAEKEAREAGRAKKKERATAAKARAAEREDDRLATLEAGDPVTDTASFLRAIERRVADRSRLAKALSMLKADRFQLFVDAGDAQLVGVVKSQSDASLVYGCRLASDGSFACCTQNLNVCGGLRGALCKHALVLVIGLVQAGELPPAHADSWIRASLRQKPKLDRDAMADVFLRYKGAQAGEVDWRPTETLPEDFYAY